MSQRQRDRLPTHSHASTALGLEPGGDESERAVLPAEKRKGGPARDKGGEWAAADASRGPAMAVAVPAGGRAQAVLPGEAALRRARAFSEVMTDNVSLQRTGWGAKWPGTLAHARAMANTRHIAGREGDRT